MLHVCEGNSVGSCGLLALYCFVEILRKQICEKEPMMLLMRETAIEKTDNIGRQRESARHYKTKTNG